MDVRQPDGSSDLGLRGGLAGRRSVGCLPGRFTLVTATGWVQVRRDLLAARIGPGADRLLAVSSGCAATDVHLHGAAVARGATHALRRPDPGLGTACEQCGATLVFERLDGVPAAVRCTGCAPRSAVDTRWCC